MAYNTVTWTNGDTITEQKLDYMVANDDHVREEAAAFRQVGTSLSESEFHTGSFPTTVQMGFEIGGQTLNGNLTSSTTFVDLTGTKNWNVTALAKLQIHTLNIYANIARTLAVFAIPIWFTEDTGYLSIWAQIKKTASQGLGIRNLVVGVSRVDKGFTP